MPQAWYAVRTHARAEKAVRDDLSARAFEVFLPTVTRWSRWQDRKKAVEWPLFSGYCFARFDPICRINLLQSPRVAGVVSCDGRYSPVPDEDIDSLRRLVSSELAFDPAPFIREGDPVRVVSGPLRGVFGRLVRKGAHARLVIAVDIIAQAVSVTLDAADVRPA